MAKTISKERWDRLRQRMIAYGIEDLPIKAIPANITTLSRNTDELTARLLILLSVAFSASNNEHLDRIADWLKLTELWQNASESEKAYFRTPDTSDEERAMLSFRFEGAYMLAWAVGIVKIFPDPSEECAPELVADFFSNVPPIFGEPMELFERTKFRRTQILHDEYLFYQMSEFYFQHVEETGKENSSNVHRAAAHERFLVLEWLFDTEEKDWDEICETNAD